MDDFEKGELKPFYKTEGGVNPKDIPIPNHDIEQIKPLFVGISTSRGCPYNCSYCNISHVFGNNYRPRPIQNVIAEIKKIPRKHLLFIYDASLTIDKNYAKALFKEMIPLKKKFIAYGSVPILMRDEELLKLASEAGCFQWNIGFESVNQESLDNDAKKSYKVDDYYKLVKKIHSLRMSVYCSLIFGFDHDKPEIFDLTLDKLYDYGIDSASFFILTPFPNTFLYEKLDNDGRILTNDWSKYDLSHVVFQPKLMSPIELKEGVTKISHKFHSFDKIIRRMVNVTITTRNFSNIIIDGYNNIVLAQYFKTIYPKIGNNI